MKNKNLIVLKHTKKQITLNGSLAYPLRIGERALIIYGCDMITTSTVQAILEVSYDCLVFETRNTIYCLHNLVRNEHVEVMCA